MFRPYRKIPIYYRLIAFLEAKRKKAEEEGIKEEGTLEQIKALEKEQALDDAMQAAGGQQPGGQTPVAQVGLAQEEPVDMKQEPKESYPEPDKEGEETVERASVGVARKSTHIKPTWKAIPQANNESSVVQPETRNEQADSVVQATTATS